jgi:uncharacterized membrane protein
MPAWRIVAAGVALAAYALASHWLMVHAANRPWAVAALFGPLLLAVAAMGWRRRQALTLVACAALLALLAVVVARGGVADINRLYVLQHAGIHLALAASFGLTLRAGSTPLISAMAARVHRHFTPALADYTRRVTGLWASYFCAMAGVSLLIYALAPWPWWSLFGNVLTPLAALTLFASEYAVRCVRHPEFERVSLRSAYAAYRQAAAAAKGSPP